MADQQGRGGQNQGRDADAGRSQHQGTPGADQRQAAGNVPGGKGEDDPSQAPESGDRKATG
jgi:hypothetical protein